MRPKIYWTELEDRLSDWVTRAVRRRPAREERHAAAVRVAAPHSAKLRRSLLDATDVMVCRKSYARPLYGAAVLALADAGERGLAPLLAIACRANDDRDLVTFAAAAALRSTELDQAIAHHRSSRHPKIAFAALLLQRRATLRGSDLLDVVARLKESARIELCNDLFAPILAQCKVTFPANAAPALRALRESERHLGRWLVLAHVARACGDDTPLDEARRRAARGSQSARAAWSLIAWALAPEAGVPTVRPTTEIVARLSDRPTTARDMSFLFRLAAVRAKPARGLLESMSKPPLCKAAAVRAASALASGYDSPEALGPVHQLAEGKAKDLHGIAAAALWDGGACVEARQHAAALGRSRNIAAAVWGGLVLRARPASALISEASFRGLEQGWVH